MYYKSIAHPDVPQDVLDPGLAVVYHQVLCTPGLAPDVLHLQEAAGPGLQGREEGHQLLRHLAPVTGG